jgi:hypothetical protein
MSRTPKPCPYCRRVCTYSNLRRHIYRHHSEVPRRVVKGPQLHCLQCRKTFARSQRSRHVKQSHQGQVRKGVIVEVGSQGRGFQPSKKRNKAAPPSQGNTAITPQKDTATPQKDTTTPRKDTVIPSLLAHDYQARVVVALARARADAKERLGEIDQTTSTRLSRELPIFHGLLQAAITPDVAEYDGTILDTITADTVDHEKQGYQLVICSDEEASDIFRCTTPMVPVLIPRERFTRPPHRLDLQQYLDIQASKDQVDLHQYGPRSGGKGESALLRPDSLEGRDAVAIFRSASRLPVNFLNLDIQKSNPNPWFIADKENLHILRTVRERNDAGKQTNIIVSDLSSCSSFQICGKAGAFSMPHMDHHGVATIVFCDEGEKLWLTFPHLDGPELREWARSGQTSPDYRPFAVHLLPGDLLILPPGRVHAPYSMTDVLMTGTMHWDTRNMVQVVRQSILELDHPTITNEDPAKEFTGKLRAIEALWRNKAPPWEWGSDQELEEFSRLLRVCHPATVGESATNENIGV